MIYMIHCSEEIFLALSSRSDITKKYFQPYIFYTKTVPCKSHRAQKKSEQH